MIFNCFGIFFLLTQRASKADGCSHADHMEKLNLKFSQQLKDMADAYVGWSHKSAHNMQPLIAAGLAGVFTLHVVDTYCELE